MNDIDRQVAEIKVLCEKIQEYVDTILWCAAGTLGITVVVCIALIGRLR